LLGFFNVRALEVRSVFIGSFIQLSVFSLVAVIDKTHSQCEGDAVLEQVSKWSILNASSSDS
jgi:hypothetical protein